MENLEKLTDRVAELEIKVAFQDEIIEALENSVVIQQQATQKLEHKLDVLSGYLKSLREDPIKPLNEETPPPHY